MTTEPQRKLAVRNRVRGSRSALKPAANLVLLALLTSLVLNLKISYQANATGWSFEIHLAWQLMKGSKSNKHLQDATETP
jgi:hypothetical protein